MLLLATGNRAEDTHICSAVLGGYLEDLVSALAKQFLESCIAATAARERPRLDRDPCRSKKSIESFRCGYLGG